MRNRNSLGYDADGRHSARLTADESRFAGILWDGHVGKANAISADELAVKMYFVSDPGDADLVADTLARLKKADALDQAKREIRALQNHLLALHEHLPVLSAAGAGGGYWIAESAAEAEAFYGSFRRRAMTGLKKASRGKQQAMVDMFEQLSLEFDGPLDLASPPPARPDSNGRSLAAALVDRFLERMTADPERFAGDLARLRDRFGTVLMPKARAAEIKKLAEDLVGKLAGI